MKDENRCSWVFNVFFESINLMVIIVDLLCLLVLCFIHASPHFLTKEWSKIQIVLQFDYGK